jgi:hypothetical protein
MSTCLACSIRKVTSLMCAVGALIKVTIGVPLKIYLKVIAVFKRRHVLELDIVPPISIQRSMLTISALMRLAVHIKEI